MVNMVVIVGVLRGGGDVRFLLALDGCTIWVVGVPLATLGGLVLHLPVYWVYLLVMAEELTKWGLGLRRFFTRRWIHDLTQAVRTA
jgi:Na+-driven multidrug efflux pump